MSTRALAERLADGTVLGAEGYVFELERRGYTKAVGADGVERHGLGGSR